MARTQWQIQTSLGADLTGSEAGLRLYYKFDEGSGDAANSATATGAAFNGTLTGGTTRSGPARLIVTSNADSGSGSLRQAVTIAAGRVPLEASGNVTLETINAIAVTGVDYISSGALTHSVKALDISLTL